jgi:hypothetical protein
VCSGWLCSGWLCRSWPAHDLQQRELGLGGDFLDLDAGRLGRRIRHGVLDALPDRRG